MTLCRIRLRLSGSGLIAVPTRMHRRLARLRPRFDELGLERLYAGLQRGESIGGLNRLTRSKIL
ncbi:hypothetical protein WT49_15665 [Burkholderia territorii]|nr:hypothetical protein WS51_14635 [Burkholderia territorii]KWE34111.1 hypothetical protein WT49_15665 [Burkholderia territorii]KWE44880.1 hypothetical protein WT50_09115 [Burkholderia territorii]KWE45198.1 hypothetical protein WT51_00265 [Burkholderia territorii]